MSLTVPPALLEQAQEGEISSNDFLQCIQESLPYAWQLLEGLANRLKQNDVSLITRHHPPDEKARGQLLCVLSSDSMRHALEEHYGVKLAFQNCHRVALFKQDRLDATYREFISPRKPNPQPET